MMHISLKQVIYQKERGYHLIKGTIFPDFRLNKYIEMSEGTGYAKYASAKNRPGNFPWPIPGGS
jgi:hypothetical protein